MSQSVSDVLSSAQSAELVVDNVTDNGRDRDIRSDLVSSWRNLRNLNYDVECWWLTIRERPGQHSQFLRRLTLCFCPQVQNKLNSQSLASRSNVHNRVVLGCERRPEYHYRWGLHGLSLCLKMLNTNLGIWKTLLPGILGFGAQQPPSLHYCLCFLARCWLTT